MVKRIESAAQAELFEELKRVREAAIEHYVAAQRLTDPTSATQRPPWEIGDES